MMVAERVSVATGGNEGTYILTIKHKKRECWYEPSDTWGRMKKRESVCGLGTMRASGYHALIPSAKSKSERKNNSFPLISPDFDLTRP